MSKTLTNKALQDAADELGIELAAIRAVDEIESRGSGFIEDGRVKILFERHKFHSLTGGKFSASHPKISNPKAGGYGKAGAHQYARFSEAFALDPDAAMKSASWGRYQIMGFNHKWAGFATVGAFVDAMKVSEDEQLKAFVKVIRSWGLTTELKNKDWANFARQYNGKNYKINKYDTKLAAAYAKFKHELLVTESVTEHSPQPDLSQPDKGETVAQPAEETAGTVPPAAAVEVKASEVPFWTRLTSISIPAGVITAIGAIAGFAKDLPPYAWFALGAVVIAAMVIGYLIYRDSRNDAHERTKIVLAAAADKGKNDLRLV